MAADEEWKQFPPYVSYKSFNSLMNMFQQQFATRIDLSYTSGKFSVRTGTDLILALRFLNFIDDGHRPMPVLKVLVAGPTIEHRAALLRQVADDAYAFVLKGELDTQTATYMELEAVFQKAHRLPDDIYQKCIKFFIEFSKDAGIPLSPEITKKQKVPRISLEIEPFSPGAYLKKELIAQKFSQREFARRSGISSNAISEIIMGKKTITAEIALQLEELIPTFPARFWLYWQSDFQLAKALSGKNLQRHCL